MVQGTVSHSVGIDMGQFWAFLGGEDNESLVLSLDLKLGSYHMGPCTVEAVESHSLTNLCLEHAEHSVTQK